MCIMKFHVLVLHVRVTCSIFLVNYSFIFKMQCRFEYLDFFIEKFQINFVRHICQIIIYIFRILHILCSFIIHIKVCLALKSIEIPKNISKTLFIKKIRIFRMLPWHPCRVFLVKSVYVWEPWYIK